MSMKRAWFYSALLSALVLFGLDMKRAEKTPGTVLSSSEAHASVLHRIQYGFTLENTTNRMIEKGELWTYAPLPQTATQSCGTVDASHPYRLLRDDLGNRILHFTLRDLPPFSVTIITIKADLVFTDTPYPVAVETPQHYLKPEPFVESDDPQILQLARQLRGKDSMQTARHLFRWVAGNIRYAGYLREERGALYALRKREGDCTEYTDLFVALCRAGGIPARGIGGYPCGSDALLKPNTYHNWAEFFQDGAWHIADPQRKVFLTDSSPYVAMRVTGESRESPMENFSRFRFGGEGLKVRMND